jgi:hypothetical protein
LDAVATALRPFTADVTVNLRGGHFVLTQPLILGPGAGGDGPKKKPMGKKGKKGKETDRSS